MFTFWKRRPDSWRRIIQDLTHEVIVDVGALYKASEAVALLDLLWSFAHATISKHDPQLHVVQLHTFGYSVNQYETIVSFIIPKIRCFRSIRPQARPEFTGTLAIKGGRHPVLENVQFAGATVPNDVYCCEASTFQIVQGPKYVGFVLRTNWM